MLNRRLRNFRTYHKIIGLILALLVIISAVTGIFLALKKNIDLLQPSTQKGQAADLNEWMPVNELAVIGQAALQDHLRSAAPPTIDRMDVRPGKGVVKVTFEEGWWEVQVDGATGEVLSIARRHSDWIEQIHDGSIVSDGFKLVSMHTLGIGLLLMIFTGWWLWYGPRKIRQRRRRREDAAPAAPQQQTTLRHE